MFIDIHSHVYPEPFPPIERAFYAPKQLLDLYDETGIEKGVLLPLVSPEVYIPQSNNEIITIAGDSGGRFIPFCNVDPRALTNSADAPLGDLLRFYRDQGCKGIGEVMPNLPFLDPLVQNLFRHVQDVGFPLTFDISDRIGGDYGLYDDEGLPQLERSLQRFPRLIILGHGPEFWAEIAQLEAPGDRSGYPDYPIREEGTVPKLFRKYPNLHGDLSAGSGYNALNRDRAYAARFVNEFQDRLLYGTDVVDPPTKPCPLGELLIALKEADEISGEVFTKVARDNAARLLAIS